MYYLTEGKPSFLEDQYLDKVVTFASDFLSIEYDTVLDFTEDLGDTAGYVDIEHGEIVVYINPAQSIIEITRTIFHELVHAKQLLEGRLEEACGINPAVWCGEPYHGKVYSEQPWEIEAYSVEEVMSSTFYREA